MMMGDVGCGQDQTLENAVFDSAPETSFSL